MAKNNKLSNDIELERQKAAVDIAKANTGVGCKGATEALQAWLAAQTKVLADNNGQMGGQPFNKLLPTEQPKAAITVIGAQDSEIAGKLSRRRSVRRRCFIPDR